MRKLKKAINNRLIREVRSPIAARTRAVFILKNAGESLRDTGPRLTIK